MEDRLTNGLLGNPENVLKLVSKDPKSIFRVTPFDSTLRSFSKEIVWPETEEERRKLCEEIVEDINSKNLGFKAKLVNDN